MTEKQRRAWAQDPNSWTCINATADGFVREYQMQHMNYFFLEVKVKESHIDWEQYLGWEKDRQKRIEVWQRRGLYQMILNPDKSIRELRDISQTQMYELMKEAEKNAAED